MNLSESQRKDAQEDVRDELLSVVLIEVLVKNRDKRFDVGEFSQPGSDQVAYDEAFRSIDGTSLISRFRQPDDDVLRIAFFLHYFDLQKPLNTSYGGIPIPQIEKMPQRLLDLVPYRPVD